MESQYLIDRAKRDAEAASAWYAIKGAMQAIDSFDKTLVEVYGEHHEELAQQRLSNFESALDTLRALIAKHAPDHK